MNWAIAAGGLMQLGSMFVKDPKKRKALAMAGGALTNAGSSLPGGAKHAAANPAAKTAPATSKDLGANNAANYLQQQRASTPLATPQPNVAGQNNNNMKVQNPAANKHWDSGSLNKMLNSRNLGPPPNLAKDTRGPMPQYVKDSLKRQYKGGPDYKPEDRMNVIKWNMQKADVGGGTQVAAAGGQQSQRSIGKDIGTNTNEELEKMWFG